MLSEFIFKSSWEIFWRKITKIEEILGHNKQISVLQMRTVSSGQNLRDKLTKKELKCSANSLEFLRISIYFAGAHSYMQRAARCPYPVMDEQSEQFHFHQQKCK